MIDEYSTKFIVPKSELEKASKGKRFNQASRVKTNPMN